MSYKIVRYYFEAGSIVKYSGLTLAQAQEHCNREDTQAKKDKDGHRSWFDGYVKE